MQTRVCRLYGKKDLRLEYDDVAEPGPGGVLVRVQRGGICGSDLHYYLDGGFGQVRVREPIIVGHEFAGIVEAVSPEVISLKVGDRVGINPSQPCSQCRFCLEGLPQHCLNMQFIGSAMLLPHVQGGFRDRLVLPAEQCIKGGPDTPYEELACAEPLAVCLHAAKRAGQIAGQRVLVNGVGPIGALCVAVAKQMGAMGIVVADLYDKTLAVAKEMGAEVAINVATQSSAFEPYFADKGSFDLVFECSGAQNAMESIFKAVRPQGTIVQVGVSGSLSVPLNMLVGKEVKWLGSHRFHSEYAEAVSLIGRREIDLRPIITDTFALEDVHEAFAVAADRSKSVKVQLSFDRVDEMK